MTDEHALAEGLPGEVVGRREATGTKEVARGVHNVRMAIKNGRQVTLGTVPL
jgi:hypothetical protein